MLFISNYQSSPARACESAILAAVLTIGIGTRVQPVEAAPFAYVANSGSNTVSVIDTADNKVVKTVTVGFGPLAVAVTPDGKHAYVTAGAPPPTPGTVSVIDTASNTVMATVPVGGTVPDGVAITPDGKFVYVTNSGSSSVAVIDTATNKVVTVPVGGNPFGIAITPDGQHVYVVNGIDSVLVIETATNNVVATVPVGIGPLGIAISPDGKHAYVTNEDFDPFFPGTVSVIDTAKKTVVATVPVGKGPQGVSITPDGSHAYVADAGSNAVSVIDTATNTVVDTVLVGIFPIGVAVTPDGKQVYVTNSSSPGSVSVIDTAHNNRVTATIPVGNGPSAVGIVPPPTGVPFLAFNAKLQIDIDRAPKKDAFALESSFTLSSTDSNGIHPAAEPVTLQVGTFTTTIPPGSFKKHDSGLFTFHGVIDGVRLRALIKRTGTLRYAFLAVAEGANLKGTKNPVQVTLAVGDDSGTTSVKSINLEGLAEAQE